jgi:hypothetical protein
MQNKTAKTSNNNQNNFFLSLLSDHICILDAFQGSKIYGTTSELFLTNFVQGNHPTFKLAPISHVELYLKLQYLYPIT